MLPLQNQEPVLAHPCRHLYRLSKKWLDGPLQNEEPTVSAMLPLQNQEPVLAHPCRHLGCPKKWFWRTSTESGTCHKSSTGFSLQNQGTQSNFFGALLWFSETLKPLQNEEPTVSAMLPLENQEPVIAYNCISLQALRLSKKMVLADPRGSW